MSKAKPFCNESFLRRIRDYLPMDAAVWDIDERRRPSTLALATGTVEHRFYLFDAESMLAASHAIEELALDEANGTLLALMQDFRYFEPHRERYWQLAATLEDVTVAGQGRRPASHRHLKFLTLRDRMLARYWAVLYVGKDAQVMLAGRQTSDTAVFERKRFLSFYSFEPRLIERLRKDITNIRAGRQTTMAEFERLLAIDQAARRIDLQFHRERRNVEAAVRKLQLNGGQYEPRRFATDVSRSLHRLKLFAEGLPRLADPAHPPLHD